MHGDTLFSIVGIIVFILLMMKCCGSMMKGGGGCCGTKSKNGKSRGEKEGK